MTTVEEPDPPADVQVTVVAAILEPAVEEPDLALVAPPEADPVPRPGQQIVGLDLVLGVASLVAEWVDDLGRRASAQASPVTRLVLRPPLVGQRLQPGHWLAWVAGRGQRERALVRAQLNRLLDAAVPMATAELLPRIDQATLSALVDQVMNAIDLPEIIRQSSGSMASETVQGARMQAIAGDEAIARVMDRLLMRKRGRSAMSSAGPDSTTTSSAETRPTTTGP